MQNFVQSFYTWYRQTLRHTKYRWLIIGGTLLYLLSPIDISPDFIPVIGWIDDGILATLLVTEVSALVMEELKRRGIGRTPSDVAQVTDVNAEVVDVPVN
ncbi:MAG: YkvA family protein [Limnospira sp.]